MMHDRLEVTEIDNLIWSKVSIYYKSVYPYYKNHILSINPMI